MNTICPNWIFSDALEMISLIFPMYGKIKCDGARLDLWTPKYVVKFNGCISFHLTNNSNYLSIHLLRLWFVANWWYSFLGKFSIGLPIDWSFNFFTEKVENASQLWLVLFPNCTTIVVRLLIDWENSICRCQIKFVNSKVCNWIR